MQVAVNLTSLSRITEVEAVCAGRVALHYPEVYLLCKSEYEKEEERKKMKKETTIEREVTTTGKGGKVTCDCPWKRFSRYAAGKYACQKVK
jgi:hypothetical protein